MPKNKIKHYKKTLPASKATLSYQKSVIEAKLNEIQENKTAKFSNRGKSPIFSNNPNNTTVTGNISSGKPQPGTSRQVIQVPINKPTNIDESSKPGSASKQELTTTDDKSTIYMTPKPLKATTPSVPNLNRNVITLVGRQRAQPNQQKKILKFQMQMQTIQAVQMQQRLAAQQNTLMQNNPGGFTPDNTPMAIPNPPVETVAPIPPPVQRDIVETVFSMDQDTAYVSPETIQPTNSQQFEAPNSVVDRYGSKYPAGIPKSFLRQQNNTGLPTTEAWPNHQTNIPTAVPSQSNITSPLLVQTNNQEDIAQPYSPSELYEDVDTSQDRNNEDSKSSDQPNQKRLSAFQRLGPQTQPKKPKLTISLTVNEDQEVREVVDDTEEIEEITPVHLREDIILSTDETVVKFVKAWPWKRNVVVRKSVTARSSKTVMILEREQMEEIYQKDTLFVQVTIKGYPPSWTKEQVLDLLMENMRGYSFIPCFIEFNKEQCKFLTLRCRSALLCLHKCGFIIRKDDVELTITLAQTDLTLNHIDFVPRLILRKRMNFCLDNTKLDLSAFTLKPDISHFIYFPLNRLYNQTELVLLQTEVTWANLTHLNLSHNRITSLDGFELDQSTPKLKHLDLSHNCLKRITALLSIRNLPLKSIHLDGNPLCTDYTDPRQYIQVIKMMFPTVTTIDDVAIQLKGDMPKFIRNYCPESAKQLVEKFLEIYFPLLDGDDEHRTLLSDVYDENAHMTITFHYKLGFGTLFRCYKSLFQNARILEENKLNIILGSDDIINNIVNWPPTQHDPRSMTVDVFHHSDSTTILRIDGILKLGRASLPEEEALLAFTKTLVLHTNDFVEYKIKNEMLYWGIPTIEYSKTAYPITAVKLKVPKIGSTTDESLQQELLKIFMKLTLMDKNISERCLEFKKWNLKEALDHFSNLLKLNSLDALTKDI